MEKNCERCGTPYEAKDRRGRYCPSCRPLVARERDAGRWGHGPVSLQCKRCGVGFTALRSDAKWCAPCGREQMRERSASFELRTKYPCPECGKPKARKGGKCRACSNRERGQRQRGENSPTWKGGRVLRKKDGYWELRINGERILEHRYVWQQAHGPIPSYVFIHHANGNKQDNRLENLVATDARGHRHRERMVDPYVATVAALESKMAALEAELATLKRAVPGGNP